jgi:hypothetical protein
MAAQSVAPIVIQVSALPQQPQPEASPVATSQQEMAVTPVQEDGSDRLSELSEVGATESDTMLDQIFVHVARDLIELNVASRAKHVCNISPVFTVGQISDALCGGGLNARYLVCRQ